MFDGVIISDTARAALEAAAAERRIPHAVVLEGTDSENRAKAAYELARAAVCSGERPPCGECHSCMKALKRIHPDITVLSKPEKKAFYPIDDIRAVKTDAYIAPGEADMKVYIFSEAQFLNTASQNALLKLIEEPPKRAMFILTCPSVSYLLETVRSRAPSFFLGDVPGVGDDEQSKQLSSKLARLLCTGNEADFMNETAVFEKDKNLFISVLGGLEACFTDALVIKSGSDKVIGDEETARLISSSFTSQVILGLFEAVRSMSDTVQYNVNQNLAVTRLCAVLYALK